VSSHCFNVNDVVDFTKWLLITPECKAVVPKVINQPASLSGLGNSVFLTERTSRQVNWNEMVSGSETELPKNLSSVASKTFDKLSYSLSSPCPNAKWCYYWLRCAWFMPDACVMATALGLFWCWIWDVCRMMAVFKVVGSGIMKQRLKSETQHWSTICDFFDCITLIDRGQTVFTPNSLKQLLKKTVLLQNWHC